jgi:hypothetical protein
VIFNDLRAWLRSAMEGEMVNQPTAEDRLIDRRSVLRTGAALAAGQRCYTERMPKRSPDSVERRR